MAKLPYFMNLDLSKLTWAGWLVMLGTLAVFILGILAVGMAAKAVGWEMTSSRTAAMLVVLPVLFAAGGFFWACRYFLEAHGITVYRE
jgi:hypothetical protein